MPFALRATLAWLLAVPATALAGVTLTYELPQGPQTVPYVVQAEGKRVRIEVGGAQPFVTLYDDAQGLVTLCDLTGRTAQQLSRAQLAEIDAQRPKTAKDAEAMVRANLGKMSPEQRAQAEAMLKSGNTAAFAPPPVMRTDWLYTFTREKQKIGEFTCELYKGTQGRSTQQLCVLPWAKSPVRKDELQGLTAMADALKGLQTGAAGSEVNFAQELALYPGLPVTLATRTPTRQARLTLKSVKRGPLAADAFALPPGVQLNAPMSQP